MASCDVKFEGNQNKQDQHHQGVGKNQDLFEE
jgi:hypothetical protein